MSVPTSYKTVRCQLKGQSVNFKETVVHILSVAVCYVLQTLDKMQRCEILNLAVLKVTTLGKGCIISFVGECQL